VLFFRGMASTTVQQLRNDLEECKAEVGKMEEIVRNINTAISKAESLKIENETVSHLREQKAQLVKDIDNYKHMLQEAEDLKKSWDKVNLKLKRDAFQNHRIRHFFRSGHRFRNNKRKATERCYCTSKLLNVAKRSFASKYLKFLLLTRSLASRS